MTSKPNQIMKRKIESRYGNTSPLPFTQVMNKFHFMPQLIFTEDKRKRCSIIKDKFELIWVILNKLDWNKFPPTVTIKLIK